MIIKNVFMILKQFLFYLIEKLFRYMKWLLDFKGFLYIKCLLLRRLILSYILVNLLFMFLMKEHQKNCWRKCKK